jgi:hypothetical protein
MKVSDPMGPATREDIFVRRRCIEIEALVAGDDVTDEDIESALAEVNELDEMRLFRERVIEYEAAHGSSSTLLFRWRKQVTGSYDQTVAVRALRARLEGMLEPVAA